MIIVAAHREFNTKELLKNYLPVHVGALNSDNHLGYQKDSDGLNISAKNPNYCELTALYYILKNRLNEFSYLGLVHYRRYFVKESFKALSNSSHDIIDEEYISSTLSEYDIILPVKRHYPFITAKSHYIKNHNAQDLNILEKVLHHNYPEYITSYNNVMNSSSIHLYNMFVLRTDLAEEYLLWLFDILEKVESDIDISQYDSYQARVFGFLSERLLNVWVVHKNLKVKTLNLYEPDGRRYIEKAKKFIKNLV